MLKNLLGLVFLVGLHTGAFAAENLYEKNYRAQNTSNLTSTQANPDTKMYVSNHKDDDNISMLENGYDMMGTSGFEAGDVAPELALQHAKSIKADTVLIYKKYGSAKTAASKIQIIKEAAKKGGGEIDAEDLTEEPTQYKYFASYWAKLPAPLLGVHVIKLKNAGGAEESAAENGLTVLAVVRGSPAATAGLMRGDILLKINDIALDKPEELSTVVNKFQGQHVAIQYEREGESKITQATVNRR